MTMGRRVHGEAPPPTAPTALTRVLIRIERRERVEIAEHEPAASRRALLEGQQRLRLEQPVGRVPGREVRDAHAQPAHLHHAHEQTSAESWVGLSSRTHGECQHGRGQLVKATCTSSAP